jgi:hypothetical protein
MLPAFFHRKARLWHALALATAVGATGCADTTTPSATTPDGAAEFDAQIDPSGSSFVLKRLETTLAGRALVRVDLIGSNVRTDASNETVSIDVAVRNAGDEALHAPATVWLHRFVPPTVRPTNADVVRGGDGSGDSTRIAPVAWGFDYSELLGEDAVLEPDETSAHKTWEFSDPGLLSFAFGAQARFGMQPDRPQISGTVFEDENRNGRRDRGEGPFNGVLTLTTPDNQAFSTRTDDQGRYRFAIEVEGLYGLRYVSVLHPPPPWPPDDQEPWPRPAVRWCVTSPNPLEVLILAAADGEPMGFTHADFGVVYGSCDGAPPIPLLLMTDRQPDDIAQDPYDLLDAKLAGDILNLRVGISGCSPDHPFDLYAGRGFMESNPVQTWALLAHDDRDEPCDAYFERTLQFDLSALRAQHVRAYGRTGVVILRFRDFRGNVTRFEFGP